MEICYVDKTFSSDHEGVIDQANVILAEYAAAGYDLTLRQLYYQFVARALIPNTEQSYKRLGGIISEARLAGRISWHAIEDRTRFVRSNTHWDGPADIIRAARLGFAVDMWDGQPRRAIVLVEKDAALSGVERVCNELDVPYLSCRGYTSQSEEWRLAQRLSDWEDGGQGTVLLYLGDHDPSGIDMTRDHVDRLRTFGVEPEVRRLALNYDQVQQYNPPPNPTKLTDSRAADYIRQFGGTCWELDALSPKMIEDLVRAELSDIIDPDAWQARQDVLDAGNQRLDELLKDLG